MREAVERIFKAIDAKEKILVWGDYDVDGTTGTVLLRKTLKILGGETAFHVPNRFTEGYGINIPALEEAKSSGCTVVISVDCGIRSFEPVAWAKNNSGNTKKLSITGFCWGGRIVWLYSAHNKNVDAGAAWYGRLASAPNAPKNAVQPTMPIDIAKDLRVPVLGLYGGQDQGIPLDSVQRMQDELKKGKSKSEIIVYPEAGHGFHADYRPSYDEPAAKDGWARCLAWFRQHGVG